MDANSGKMHSLLSQHEHVKTTNDGFLLAREVKNWSDVAKGFSIYNGPVLIKKLDG